MRVFLAAALVFASIAPSFAEVVVKEKERVAPEEKVKVEKDKPDCSSKTVHKEDGAGDSKTVTKTDC